MKLTAQTRGCGKHSIVNQIRNNGNIPAVIYSKNNEAETIEVAGTEFQAILRSIEKGHLPTTIIELKFGDKSRKAIVKDIQYHKTTYNILHLDFLELVDGNEITLNVPVHFVNAAECIGIKLGGFLRQLKRHVKVKCDPKHIPSGFYLDLKDLGLRQVKRVGDISFPKGVEPLVGLKEVIVGVGK